MSVRSFGQKSSSLAILAASFWALAASTSGCSPAAKHEISGQDSPIVFGARESGYPEVVYLGVNLSGESNWPQGGCTATLIHPRVLLTAKHCVVFPNPTTQVDEIPPASEFGIIAGTSVFNRDERRGPYAAVSIHTPPGTGLSTDNYDGNDLALVVLRSPLPDATPRAYSTETPMKDSPVTVIGYGVREGGRSGTKYSGTTTISDLVGVGSRSFVSTNDGPYMQSGGANNTNGAQVCSGDSGGPALNAQGRIIGVASFVDDVRNDCMQASGYHTLLKRHADFIADIVAEVDGCQAAVEICDGKDNDCNGLIDDASCLDARSPCDSNMQCKSNDCEPTPDGAACKEVCVPAGPTICAEGFQCNPTGCGIGECIEASAGTRRNGENCVEHADCASYFCNDFGNGTKICGEACGSFNACPDGSECITGEESCGVCTPTAAQGKVAGSSCSAGSECASGSCENSVCLARCDANDDCTSNQHCTEGLCQEGRPSVAFGYCANDGFCPSEAPLCVENICTKTCILNQIRQCPSGLTCAEVDAQNVCTSALKSIGEICSSNEECNTTLCAGTCTVLCNESEAVCPDNFACQLAGTQKGCFPIRKKSGCTIQVGSAQSSWASELSLSLFAFVCVARRRSQKNARAAQR